IDKDHDAEFTATLTAAVTLWRSGSGVHGTPPDRAARLAWREPGRPALQGGIPGRSTSMPYKFV
ncbi:hypothetical protein, partial [Nonomuraea sp. bgisy101]|uniref:hypothetical protein n=1 Tax=Nonomuraea sp. bgisy101 TaxID=3413784 RepID=UPI003D7328EF